MKKMIFVISLLAITIALTTNADVYEWKSMYVNHSGSWDENTNWFNVTATNRFGPLPGYPYLAGDVAFIRECGTNDYFQIWPNQNTNLYANVANISIVISNELIFGAGGDNRIILNNPNGKSVIALTNMVPANQGFVNSSQFSTYFDTWMILSNELEIISTGPTTNDATEAGFAIGNDSRFYGDYPITKNGEGAFMIGAFPDHAPEVRTTKPVTVNGGICIVSSEARVDPPLRLNSITDCNNEFVRCNFMNLGDIYNVDFVLSNAYFDFRWPDWPGGTNEGNLTVYDWSLINPVENLRFRFLNDVNGKGEIWKGYSDSNSGELDFTGSISPGVNDIDYLYFRDLFNPGMHFGVAGDPVDLNIQIDGMRDGFGVDADAIIIQGESSIPLDYINLNLFTDGPSNPYRTNEVMYSADSAFLGSLNSVVWSDPGRTGEVIVTPESVYITGVTPLSNFFDIYKDEIVLVKGETQEVLVARSPFEMDVNAVADESWITVQPVISLSNDALVSVPVTVPVDQPVTNGFGLSKGTIRFSSATDPSVYIDESVYVLEPGYFELDKSKLFFIADRASSDSINVSSFLNVNVNADNQGNAWITLDKSSVSITNNRKSVGVEITEQSAGTTGTIRFENDDILGVVHDVEVEVVENGYFEVPKTSITFIRGETQKYVNVSSPFRADVKISSTDSWVAVSSLVSLDNNGYNLPVIIPADQAAGSTGTITLVNSCFTNISFSVEVIVVPPSGNFTINTNLLEFVTGVDTQKFIKVSDTDGATINIQPVSGSSWITVTNNIFLLNSTTDVSIEIPIDQAGDSTGMVRFTSIENPSITNDVDVIVVPEPFAIVSILFAIGALAFRRLS